MAAGAWQAKSPPGLREAGGDVHCLGRERSLLGVVEEQRNCIAEEGGVCWKMMQLVRWIRQPRLEVAN